MSEKRLKVLVCFEKSQKICSAFRTLGHEAYTCDPEDPSGLHFEWAIKGDCVPLLNGSCSFETLDGKRHGVDGEWDLIVATLPSRYFSTASACRLYHHGEVDPRRLEKGMASKRMLMKILHSDCRHVCVESTTPMKVFEFP